jgi:hypothetical protein
MNELLISFGVSDAVDKVAVTDHYDRKIFLRSDINQDLLAESFLHELFHVIITDAGITAIPAAPDISEAIVTMISPRLLDVLRMNSELLKELCITTSVT